MISLHVNDPINFIVRCVNNSGVEKKAKVGAIMYDDNGVGHASGVVEAMLKTGINDVVVGPVRVGPSVEGAVYHLLGEIAIDGNIVSIKDSHRSVFITVLGDVNGDGVVDIFDLAEAGKAYESQPGDANWNRDADLNNDRIVNDLDLETIRANFGRSV